MSEALGSPIRAMVMFLIKSTNRAIMSDEEVKDASKIVRAVIGRCMQLIDQITCGLEPLLAQRWASSKLYDKRLSTSEFSFATYKQNPQFKEFPPKYAFVIELFLQYKTGNFNDHHALQLYAFSAGSKFVAKESYAEPLKDIRSLQQYIMLLIKLILVEEYNAVDGGEEALVHLFNGWIMQNFPEGGLRTVLVNNDEDMLAVVLREGWPLNLPWIVGELVLRLWLMVRPLELYINELIGKDDQSRRLEFLFSTEPHNLDELLRSTVEETDALESGNAPVSLKQWDSLRQRILSQLPHFSMQHGSKSKTLNRDYVKNWEQILGLTKEYYFNDIYVKKYGRNTILPLVVSKRYE
uniref:ARAD1C11572p n=1 Tax=Blastobotrys adeninivorans TaxID=409370 RepID=A0A060SZV5_BLAAD